MTDENNDDWSALMYAAEIGSNEMVETLLKHGADPGIEAGIGDYALCVALEHGHDQVAKTLLKVAPDVHIKRVYHALSEDQIKFLKES